MAAEYEIKEVGFIGSLWQGEFNSSLNIGKTVEITNVLNTIDSGRRQSVFFSTEENIDLQKMNNQLPDDYFYYEIGILSGTVLDDLSRYTKIDKEFLKNQKVLFRYNSKAPTKDVTTSILPIQENWSFDISNLDDVEYIYNLRESILFVNYVFLVSEQYRETLITYFTELQQEGFLSANPPVETQSVDPGLVPKTSTVMPPPGRPLLGRGIFDPLIINEEEIEKIAIRRFTSALFGTTAIPEEVIDPNTGLPFPDVDLDEFADPVFIANTLEEVNANLKQVEERMKIVRDSIENIKINGNPTSPFGSLPALMVEMVFLNMIKVYLYDRIRSIENVGFPDQEPERYSVDEDGNIEVSPPIPSPAPVNKIVIEATSEFDEFIDEIIEDLEIDDNNTYVFKKISKVSDYDLPVLRYKTKGLFKCTGEKLSTFYTGSLTEKQQKYYTTVFNEARGTTDSYHQFDITYCHISGSGSSHIEGEVDLYPAKAMYRKYMLECFGYTNGKFPFKNNKNGDYFYAIQLDRNQFAEKLDVGNFELALCELTSSGTTSHPTSTKLFTLRDESTDSKQQIVTNEGIQEYYYVTSGSIRDGIYNEPGDDAWGVIFPKMGLIILDGVVLDQSCSFNTITGSVDGQNTKRLFLSISGAAVPTAYRPSGSFFARSFETYLTETYFCRANFDEFNTSTNYTYVTGSNGFLKYDYFKKNPHTYITTIGLYNRKKELIAVGKLRNPILKNQAKTCIFEVVVRLN